MAALQGYYLTFENVESALDLEEKLFKIKNLDDDKLTIESIPQNFPSQVWFWTNLTKVPLKFPKANQEKREKEKLKLKNKEAQNA